MMIYLNCNTSSSGHLSSDVNSVTFENVKSEYRSDDDITIEYILNTETEASSRNWIGIYPKGAQNLSEYVTFEWTIMNPCELEHGKQSVTFYAKYHMKHIEGSKEYFFLFVNKHMKVIGSSPYFHFLFYHTLDIEDLKVSKKLDTGVSSDSQSLKSFSEGNLQTFQSEVSNKMILDEICYQTGRTATNQQMHLSSTYASESISHNVPEFKAGVTLTSPDFPISVNSSLSNNNVDCCTLCKRPANFAQIEQHLNAKIKIYAEYGHTLKKRIEELEKNFEMNQVAQKQLKLVAYHAKREKSSYQKFVNEMLSVLTSKGVVRILDGHGTELLLKRVDSTQDENKKMSMYKMSQREEILKSVISSQERIRHLVDELENLSSPKVVESFTEPVDDCSLLSEINPHLEDTSSNQMQRSVSDSVAALVTVFPQTENRTEKNKTNQQHNENERSMNECVEEEDCIDHILNETYCIEKLESKPANVFLPTDNDPLKKVQLKDKYNGLDNEGQGDFHPKSTVCNENIQALKQCVMKELTNVIQKRKEEKTESLKNEHSGNFSNDSLNLSINETVQSITVKEPNALIIKGDRLQYAIIRIQQTP